jgi:cephalosporin-C deacetylase-like acetyl esterase
MRFVPALLLPLLLAADGPSTQFLDFVKAQAKALRQNDKPPTTLADWTAQRADLRTKLLAAWGGFPEKPCDLAVRKHGELKRDGYTVEKVTFQTRPGVRMTANAYVPDKKGKLPALLMVHGHWKGAKQDPVVQARCIGATKLGFFVLCVDAFGAGERGITKNLGEYHGEMVAATLLPVGLPLSGLQVYENMRAVDYLLTRPEVDGKRIGVTGASGGGNQTMYAAAMDERLKAAVPVCSVGNYQAYLGAACCLCEVVPGALTFTEESGLLAMVAPRALMVVSATKDAPQFSVDAAKVSIAAAKPVFKLHGKEASLQHAVFESGHDYNRAMREAMYGWMTLHLKGEGDGSPVKEPEVKPEKPEDLRCYPGDTRPDDFVTLPKFAAAEGKKLLAVNRNRDDRTMSLVKLLRLPTDDTHEPRLTASAFAGKTGTAVILVSFEDREKVAKGALAEAIRSAGHRLVVLEPRAAGGTAVKGDVIGRAPDHNSAEWALWIGRPLLGQWVNDVSRLAAQEESKDIVVIGDGPAGLIALCAAATERRVTKAVAVNTLASFVTDEPYFGQRLGTMVPSVLRSVGDVGHIAALGMKRVVIAGGVSAGGKPLGVVQVREAFKPAGGSYTEDFLKIIEKTTPAELLKALE